MAGFYLNCLGVGDGWPSAQRNHSSFLYRFEDGAILVDCGEPAGRAFKQTGLAYDLIGSLFLSHLHFDHVGGLFMLLQGFWLEGRTRDLTIYAPADGIAAIQQMLRAGYLFDEVLPFRLRFEPLHAGRTIQSGAVQVTPLPTTHLVSMQRQFQGKYPQNFEAYCFLIQSGAWRVGHSADLGEAEDLAPLFERPLDLLVCELAHVEPEKLFKYLAGRGIRQIAFVHLARQYQTYLKDLKLLARKVLASERVYFPADGEQISLGAPS